MLFSKKKFFIFLILFLLPIYIFSNDLDSNDPGYKILNYDFKGIVYPDNSVSCFETITVDFTIQSHGIFRSIPTYIQLNRDINGKEKQLVYHTEIQNFSVSGENFSEESSNGNKIYKIGDANKTLIGEHTYVLYYRYKMPNDLLKDVDFFYFSPLGPDWETTIDKFTFRFDFEKEFSEETNIEIHSGEYGSIGNNADVRAYYSQNHIRGEAENLKPNNAVTIYAELPDGYFSDAKKSIIILPIVFLVLTVLCSIFTLIKMLKKDHSVVQTVEFYPPEGISSAEVGYVIDSSADDPDIMSLIPYFANKGYIKIEEILKTNSDKVDFLRLIKQKDIDSKEKAYIRDFFNYLFPDSQTTRDLKDLGSDFTKAIDDAKVKLTKEFSEEAKLYKSSRILPLVLTNLSLMAFIWDYGKFSREGLFAEGILLFAILTMTASIRFKFAKTKRFSKKKGIIGRIIGGFFFFGLILGCLDTITESYIISPDLLGVLFVAVGCLNFMSHRLVKLTPYGAEITGKLLGLRHFIKVAEVPKLKLLVNENPQYFYDILPYAIVFGLTDKWANLFTTLITKNPDWYVSTRSTSYYPTNLSKMLTKNVNEPVSARRYADAPKSSGGSSHGGGHSGGGGGGGGGGRW